MNESAAIDPRLEVIRFLERELIGPSAGPDETLRERPTNRYMMGILFPRDEEATLPASTFQGNGDPDDPDDGPEEPDPDPAEPTAPGSATEEHQDPTFLAGKWEPSSVGISLFLSEGTVQVDIHGALYARPDSRSKEWHRRPLAERSHPEQVTLQAPERGGVTEQTVLMDRALLHALWRRLKSGWLVTVSLVNVAETTSKRKDPESCLFQVGLSCRAVTGTILPYPRFEAPSMDKEEDELRLLYRHDLTYGVGHGCAPHWEMEGGRATSVSTVFIPWKEVRPLTQDVPGLNPDLLDIAQVAWGHRTRAAILSDYRGMVGAYADWYEKLPMEHGDIPVHLEEARDRLRGGIQAAMNRMNAGVTLLETDDLSWQAFTLANRAMLLQMQHSGADFGGQRRTLDAAPGMPDPQAPLQRPAVWRPFQLAFMLMTLPSLHSDQDADRETVDLIWFPTGGGKTEGYLFAAAYLMILRRLRHGDQGGGTTVITRYTLRLLTAQQFRRTSALICALEWMRNNDPAGTLGAEPFSIGLWVGEGSTPNKYTDAMEKLEALLQDEHPGNPFVLDSCPWCGTEIIPARRHEDRRRYGVTATSQNFAFYCPSSACDFHAHLPVQVVDQGLYEHPPTFLLGTVDKFAMVAWRAEAGCFFGNGQRLPPELVIQDELHLLSGPLGTTVGLYECALQQLPALHGMRPKIIASTATIRRASEQVRSLFNRRVQLFPPSGLSASDSFFARQDNDPSRPGRIYAGLMSPHQSMKTAMTQVGAALVEAPRVVTSLPPEVADSYATLVTYYNSLRELGQGRKLAQDDIPSRLRSLYDRTDIYGDDQVCELTSNLNGGELTELLGRLALDPGSRQHVAVLATSNMLSVGVDIGRLGLMLMAGQPKTSSEYIQATSRVGRNAARPGLVVTLYSPGKPRDRSHYESFPTYHASLYRYVEPTSVTPFALPSRTRALHAAFATLVRHGVPGMSPENAAGLFDRNRDEVRRVVASVLSWVVRVDQREFDQTARMLDRIQQDWEERATLVTGSGRKLHYGSHARNVPGLFRAFDNTEANGLWPTLQNMRSVDETCAVTVLTR